MGNPTTARMHGKAFAFQDLRRGGKMFLRFDLLIFG